MFIDRNEFTFVWMCEFESFRTEKILKCLNLLKISVLMMVSALKVWFETRFLPKMGQLCLFTEFEVTKVPIFVRDLNQIKVMVNAVSEFISNSSGTGLSIQTIYYSCLSRVPRTAWIEDRSVRNSPKILFGPGPGPVRSGLLILLLVLVRFRSMDLWGPSVALLRNNDQDYVLVFLPKVKFYQD